MHLHLHNDRASEGGLEAAVRQEVLADLVAQQLRLLPCGKVP